MLRGSPGHPDGSPLAHGYRAAAGRQLVSARPAFDLAVPPEDDGPGEALLDGLLRELGVQRRRLEAQSVQAEAEAVRVATAQREEASRVRSARPRKNAPESSSFWSFRITDVMKKTVLNSSYTCTPRFCHVGAVVRY